MLRYKVYPTIGETHYRELQIVFSYTLGDWHFNDLHYSDWHCSDLHWSDWHYSDWHCSDWYYSVWQCSDPAMLLWRLPYLLKYRALSTFSGAEQNHFDHRPAFVSFPLQKTFDFGISLLFDDKSRVFVLQTYGTAHHFDDNVGLQTSNFRHDVAKCRKIHFRFLQ